MLAQLPSQNSCCPSLTILAFKIKKVYKSSRVFVHNGHLVHPLNVIRLLLKRMTKMNVLVLGLQ